MRQVENTCTRADAARERELYRYFEPPEVDKDAKSRITQQEGPSDGKDPYADPYAAKPPSSLENSLTALAELCALRLDVSRAVVSVIAKNTQYFLAEASKPADFNSTQASEEPDPSIWLGNGTIDKSGGLCENVLELAPCPGAYPCFTITDLSQDERFKHLSIVTGPPHFRFYAGTPLTTSGGINIGTFFVFDDKVRPLLTPAQENFFGSTAATIMGHMEVNREAEERRKVSRMSRGLNAFVEGKASFDTGDPEDKDDSTRPASGTGEEVETTHTNIEGAHKATFSRAANLLSDSLNLRTRGGVCFLDTIAGPQSAAVPRSVAKMLETESESDSRESPRKVSRLKRVGTADQAQGQAPEASRQSKLAEVISYAGSSPTTSDTHLHPSAGTFSKLEERFVQSLLKHYPRGKVWIFDAVEGLTSEEDDMRLSGTAVLAEQRERRVMRKQSEKETLRRHFPDVYELIFVPLWDAGTSRWFSGCFCWRTSISRKFSIEAELQFVIAFGNSIMAEISRLASLYESRQKGDFIGSISHELRSPLHGILASAEFLAETRFDAFQGNLIDTISSCGRTLLDTIEHILDFSKINSFERNWRNARKPRAGNRSIINEASKKAIAKEAPPLMSIYAVTDVAAIIEEVVEGVYAGQVYRDFGSADITDVSAGQLGKTTDRGSSVTVKSPLGGSAEQKNLKDIEVILDIAHDDYCFITQPGALRRVVMNIFGNSLKYTLAGKIVVRLRLETADTASNERRRMKVLNITVTDTGRGISNDYLRTGLFVPFSQENALASGTGLGLSIVRSIVSMLDGTIDIQSEIGQGTEVQIRIPLNREATVDTPVSTPSSVGSPNKLEDNSISILRTDHPSKKVSVYSSVAPGSSNESRTGTTAIAMYYAEKWFKLPLESEPLQNPTDVIIVDERCLRDLLDQLRPGPAIVVLCTKTRHLQMGRALYPGAIEFMPTPFGPFKLAKAVRLALEKANEIAAGLVIQPRTPIDSPQTSEADTPLPEFGSLTLETENDETPPIHAQSNGIVTVGESNNARMALPSSDSGASTESRPDFPFPNQGSDSPKSASSVQKFGYIMRQMPSRPKLSSRKTEPVFRPSFPYTSTLTPQGALATSNTRDSSDETASAEIDSASQTQAAAPKVKSKAEKRAPKLLLVDDNKINLRLLETFMRKRKYEYVDSAEDGALAVEAARRHEEGYDIIFMDISMPVMNGFEATRAIRALEHSREGNTLSVESRVFKPAMIVALTGLASGKDHGEAFACGVDLYMTKPVSFKEVGRLLDNWEAHGGLDAKGREDRDKGRDATKGEGNDDDKIRETGPTRIYYE